MAKDIKVNGVTYTGVEKIGVESVSGETVEAVFAEGMKIITEPGLYDVTQFATASVEVGSSGGSEIHNNVNLPFAIDDLDVEAKTLHIPLQDGDTFFSFVASFTNEGNSKCICIFGENTTTEDSGVTIFFKNDDDGYAYCFSIQMVYDAAESKIDLSMLEEFSSDPYIWDNLIDMTYVGEVSDYVISWK